MNGLFLAVSLSTGLEGIFVAAVALCLAVFWILQFVELMLLEDELFPGRHDKALWVAAFIVVFILTPFAFRMWKSARTAEAASRKAGYRPPAA